MNPKYTFKPPTKLNIPSPKIEFHCAYNVSASGMTYLMNLVLMTKSNPNALPQIIKIIRKNPRKILEKNSKGWTALSIACCNSATLCTKECIQILLEAVKNLPNIEELFQIKTSEGDSLYTLIYQYLGKSCSIECFEMLTRIIDANCSNNNGKTILMLACSNRSTVDIEIVKILIKNGVNLNFRDKNGTTALMYACNQNFSNKYSYSYELIKLLIENGADVTITNNHKKTPLIIFCGDILFRSDSECLKYLINAGSDVNHADCNKTTALMSLISNGQDIVSEDILKIFLEEDADVNNKNIEGKTFAMMLLQKNIANVHGLMNILLSYDVDFDIRDNRGYTIIQQYFMKLISLYKKKLDVDGLTVPQYEKNKYTLKMIKFLLENTNVPICDDYFQPNKMTPLLFICFFFPTKYKIIKLLLQKGSDPNRIVIINHKSHTPIKCLSLCTNHKSIYNSMRVLIEHGANIDAYYPILDIANALSTNKINLLKLFVDHGAKVNVKDSSDNKTLLMIIFDKFNFGRNFCDSEILTIKDTIMDIVLRSRKIINNTCYYEHDINNENYSKRVLKNDGFCKTAFDIYEFKMYYFYFGNSFFTKEELKYISGETVRINIKPAKI